MRPYASCFLFAPWSKFKLQHSHSQFLWSCKYMIQLHRSSSYNKIKAIKIPTLIFLPSSPSLFATFKAFLRSIRFCIALSIIETRDRKLLLPQSILPPYRPLLLLLLCPPWPQRFPPRKQNYWAWIESHNWQDRLAMSGQTSVVMVEMRL